ncbi:YHYH domain-containing protein [Mesorhizobium muleiense]
MLCCLLTRGGLAYAHSGGTDSNGCHKNHKTGDYHCH